MIADLQARLSTVRHCVSFDQCLFECAQDSELVINYDRLRGTNLAQRGSSLELAIDRASGRLEAELEGFIEFCWDYIFLRLGV